jgi:hypothetical protein
MRLAWSLATVHYVFFKLLDGRDVTSSLILRQSHVSILSLLLVTTFRAAIIATLSICFTQYMWYLLRARCLRIGLIDDLFQIRSNVLGICNPEVFRKAPVLFLAATLSWLVPLATVYPPGALTIQSELHTSFTIENASIMNPEPLQVVEQVDTRSLASIVRGVHTHTYGVSGVFGFDSATYQYVRTIGVYTYR